MAAKKGMKKCPQCKMWVDKKSGCDAMVCVCGCTFCWRCGEDVNKKGGCLCLQNLEHLSAKEKDIVIQVLRGMSCLPASLLARLCPSRAY
jgi:hypothetical protein